jgi:hypothetical protein
MDCILSIISAAAVTYVIWWGVDKIIDVAIKAHDREGD